MVYIPKTQINNADVEGFLNTIEDEQKRKDSFKLLEMFTRISGQPPKMWWSSIVWFGSYHYKTASCVWDWMRTGFSPRKWGLSVYIMPWYEFDWMSQLLEKLGKHKRGKSCLNIKKLDDIDMKILEEIVKKGLEVMEEKYPE